MTRLLALLLLLAPGIASAQAIVAQTPVTICVDFRLLNNPARLLLTGTDARGQRQEIWQRHFTTTETEVMHGTSTGRFCDPTRRPLALRELELVVQVGYGGAWQEACRLAATATMNQRLHVVVQAWRDGARCNWF